MERVAKDQLKFAIHGPDTTTDEIPASIFGQKLVQLASAIAAADMAVNGGKRAHEYVIKDLHTSTPTAILKERPIARQQTLLPQRSSGLRGFSECARAIIGGDRATAARYGACPKRIRKLATGAPKLFGYGEIWTDDDQVIRVDPFLADRAARATDTEQILGTQDPRFSPRRKWFEGVVQGTFDGAIKAVDLRGALPEIKLILSAGEATIDCVCRESDIPKSELRSIREFASRDAQSMTSQSRFQSV